MSKVYVTDSNGGRPPKGAKVVTRRDEILWAMAQYYRRYRSMPNLSRVASLLPQKIKRATVEYHVEKLLDEGRLEYNAKENIYTIPESIVIVKPETIPDFPDEYLSPL